MSERIGIVVTDPDFYTPEDPDHDTAPLVAALRARGVDAEPVIWHDEALDPAAFDLLVIRAAWDYPDRLDEFRSWLDRAEAATRVRNSPALVRWNLDKRYLQELQDADVPVIPTAYCTSVDAVQAAIASFAAEPESRVVVKPAMSAGARDTGLFEATDPAASALAGRILSLGGIAMVQPEIPELTAGAEKALYAIEGTVSHAIAKGALLQAGGGLLGGVYQENPVPVEVTAQERSFVADVLQAVADATGEGIPLYARVDTVDSAAHGLVVIEVELIEPALNLHVAPHAVGAVADAVQRAAHGERR